MDKKYQALFSINLQHSYYSNGFARELTLVPVPEAQQLFRRYDLLWRTSGNGQFGMYFGSEEGQAPPVALLDDQSVLFRFIIKSNNPYFLNATEIDFSRFQSEILSFSNVQPDPGDSYDPNFLSKGTVVTDADLVQGIVLGSELAPAPALGIVDVHVGNGNANMVPLPPNDPTASFSAPQYTLQFEARSTRWRYFLILNENIAFARMKITDGKDTMSFKIGDAELQDITFAAGTDGWQGLLPPANEAVATKPLPNGRTAFPVVSTDAYMLQEQYSNNLQLQFMDKNGTAISSINLPAPDARHISVEGSAPDQQLFYDMYVYL